MKGGEVFKDEVHPRSSPEFPASAHQ